jgi:tRNA dimethylallyltransferase
MTSRGGSTPCAEASAADSPPGAGNAVPARRRLAVLTGPTAVGKSDVAVEVARQLGAEIVCADSMQIYRRMEAGTAKPTAQQRAIVPHHLVDFVDPGQDFTVADYRRAALPVIERLMTAGKIPLVVGGTRLYIKSLTTPFASGPPPDAELRARLAAVPSADLHRQLAAADPSTAARLHPSDRRRITRALEVFQQTREPISTLQRRSRAADDAYDARLIALAREREELYRRVDERVDRMIAGGLIEEVRGFLEEGLGPDRISMQAHGYKEVMRYLLGEYDREEAVRLLKRNTRRYVKYQLIWMRGEPDVRWVRADRPVDEIAAECVRILQAEGLA